jgi:flagellar biosynthesis protein FliQ
VKGANSIPVWPFLVAALVVGVVVAALIAKKVSL